MKTITRTLLALAAVFSPSLVAVEAQANISERCRNAVCGRSTYDGTRVNIYVRSQMSGTTHFNFKTNPGAQIEIPGHYSFNQRKGRGGTYSVQACKRGGFGRSSFCTAWSTFDWDSLRN